MYFPCCIDSAQLCSLPCIEFFHCHEPEVKELVHGVRNSWKYLASQLKKKLLFHSIYVNAFSQ
jgi:hypothetical protein